MKPRARYTPRLRTWAFWCSGDDWANRTVGFGYSLDQARREWISQTLRRAAL